MVDTDLRYVSGFEVTIIVIARDVVAIRVPQVKPGEQNSGKYRIIAMQTLRSCVRACVRVHVCIYESDKGGKKRGKKKGERE